jgi:hypothetical protein
MKMKTLGFLVNKTQWQRLNAVDSTTKQNSYKKLINSDTK